MSGETKLHKAWMQAVIEAVEKFTYGDLIPAEWLYEKFEISVPRFGTANDFKDANLKFLSSVDSFRDALLQDYNMATEAVTGCGYRVIHPKDQTRIAIDRVKRSMKREIRKCVDHLTYIDRELLGPDDLKDNADAIGRISALSAFSRQKLCDARKARKKLFVTEIVSPASAG